MKLKKLSRRMFTIAALAIVGMVGTSLTSCSRSSDNNDPIITAVPIEQAIIGTWKLVKREGKVGGQFVESLVTESYEVYEANGVYKRYNDRALTNLVGGGTYKIENDILVLASSSRYKLEINGNTMVYTSSDGSKRNTYTKQ
jgi:lipoprotein